MAKNKIETLWIEIEDDPSSSQFQEHPEIDTRSEQEKQEDRLLEAVNLFAQELEDQGLSPEQISQEVIRRLGEVVPPLTVESNSYPPYDVLVNRGIEGGRVVYVDTENRTRASELGENYDDESWG